MIYNLIPENISKFLENEYMYTNSQILLSNQVPDKGNDYFVRIFWNFGTTNDFNNRDSESFDIFVIELYEKKTALIQELDDVAVSLRKDLFKKFDVVRDVSEIAKLKGISLTKNDNDPIWNGYAISMTFQILNRRGY